MKILTKKDIIASYNAIKHKDHKSMYVYHIDLLDQRLQHLKNEFPKSVLHAVAIKTNNLPEVLSYIVSQGCGLEAASFEEVKLAVNAGCDPSKIVFDGPAKTREELEYCNANFQGIKINANSFNELEKLLGLKNLNIGIRINPMLRIDSPDIFMVSGKGSKFGIPITSKERIVSNIFASPSINGLHVHPGSEISSLEQHVSCIKIVYDFAIQINKEIPNKIKWIDIGGGIKPEQDFDGNQKKLTHFIALLKKYCPLIFDDFECITEYGRFVHTHCAYAVSKVEDILEYHEPHIAIIHLGADLFLREVYSSSPPSHQYFNITSTDRQLQRYDLGGPLCFSGDFLAKNEELLKLQIGDVIAITACGSNSISMWSEHCSRKKPIIKYAR